MTDVNDVWGSGYYEHCAFGCCGYSSWYEGDSVCCSAVGPIIGILIGLGVFIGIIVAVVCCCVRTRGNRGTVFGPRPAATTTVVTTTSAQPQYQGMAPAPNYPTQPMGYGTGYQQPQMAYPPPQQYPQQPAPMGTTYTAPYPPTAQAGYAQSSYTGYTEKPDSKASAPPMDEPPPYPGMG